MHICIQISLLSFFFFVQIIINMYEEDINKTWRKIFIHHVIPHGKKLIGANFIFQRDNEPKHPDKSFDCPIPEYYLKKLKESSIKAELKSKTNIDSVRSFVCLFVFVYILFPRKKYKEMKGGSRLLHSTV